MEYESDGGDVDIIDMNSDASAADHNDLEFASDVQGTRPALDGQTSTFWR